MYIYIRNIYCIHIYIYIYIHIQSANFQAIPLKPGLWSLFRVTADLRGRTWRTCHADDLSTPWRNRLFGHVDSIDYLRFIWACRHPGFCRFVSFCPSRFQRTACFVHGANPGNAEVWGRLLESYEMVNPHQKTGINMGKSSIWQCVKTLYPWWPSK